MSVASRSATRLSGASTARLIVLAGIWGASFLFIKLALEELSPLQITLGRMTGGAVALVAMIGVQRQPLPRDPRLWGHLLVMSVVANVVPWYLFGWGEQRITSGMAGVLNGTTPLFTLVLALALLPDERLSPARAAGLLLGFAGVVLVVGPWRQDGDNLLTGQLAILLAASCYGLAFTYTRRFISGRGQPTALAAAQVGCGAAVLWLAAPLLPGAVWPNPLALTPAVLGSIAALGVFGTGIAYLLYYRLIADAGATTASMVTYLIPVFAVLLGVVVLDEALGWNQFAGAAVVILGVALAEGRLGGRRGADLEEAAGVDAPTVAPDDRRA